MKNYILNKISWLRSVAGKIALYLLLFSVTLLVVSFVLCRVSTNDVIGNINNILIGLSTNLLGIIVTVSFVQYFIDRQDEQEEKKEEIKEIARYNKVMNILIERYIMYYNCITTPIEKRCNSNSLQFKSDFPFEDMCDMYLASFYLCESFSEPSIVLFYKAEESLRNYMIRMLEGIQFKYNNKLQDIIIDFIEKSLDYDVRGAIIGNINSPVLDLIKKWIKDPNHKWVEKAHNNELGSNSMLPYVQLYDLLKMESALIIQYQNYLRNLQ